MVQGAQENHDVLQLVPEIPSLLDLTVLLCKYDKLTVKRAIDKQNI